jgi:methyl-accepting chemotaxis protein
LVLNVAVVDGVDGAMEHIARHGSGHSDAIVTRDEAVAGRFGLHEDVTMSNGTRVLAETRPINLMGLDWIMVAERNMNEILAPVNRYLSRMLAVIAVCAALVLGVGVLIARSITRPIGRVSDAMKAVASGDLSVAVQDADRQDELGGIAQSLEVLREKLQQAKEQETEMLQGAQQRVVRALSIGLRRTRFGMALLGIGADEQRAQTLGVNTRLIKIAGFALTAAVAGATSRIGLGAIEIVDCVEEVERGIKSGLLEVLRLFRIRSVVRCEAHPTARLDDWLSLRKEVHGAVGAVACTQLPRGD